MDIPLIKQIITEFLTYVSNPKKSKYDIIYKNPKFNKMVIFVRNGEIDIISIMQPQRKKNTFAPQKHQIQVELNKLFEENQFIVGIFRSNQHY